MLQLTGKPVDLYLNGELKSIGLIAKHYALVVPPPGSRNFEHEVVIKKHSSSQTINQVTVSNVFPGKTVSVDMRAVKSRANEDVIEGPLPTLMTVPADKQLSRNISSQLFPAPVVKVTGNN